MTASAVCTRIYPSDIPVVNTNEPTNALKENILEFLETVKKVVTAVAFVTLGNIALLPLPFIELGIWAQHAISKYSSSYSQRPKAVILQGAEILNLPFCMSAAKRQLYKDYQVEFYNVSSINEVNEHLKKTCNKADLLILNAHSNPESMHFASENPTKPENIDTDSINEFNVKNLDFSALSATATIILEGCNAGKEEAGQVSIARRIAAVAGGRKVFASTTVIRSFGPNVNYQKNKPTEVKFYEFPYKEMNWRSLNDWYDVYSVITNYALGSIQTMPSIRDVTASYQYSVLG